MKGLQISAHPSPSLPHSVLQEPTLTRRPSPYNNDRALDSGRFGVCGSTIHSTISNTRCAGSTCSAAAGCAGAGGAAPARAQARPRVSSSGESSASNFANVVRSVSIVARSPLPALRAQRGQTHRRSCSRQRFSAAPLLTIRLDAGPSPTRGLLVCTHVCDQFTDLNSASIPA